jgi:hypothetical protein
MRAAHMGKKNIKCVVSECPEMFERNFTLRKHVEKYHPEIRLDGANMTEKREERGYYWNSTEKDEANPRKMRATNAEFQGGILQQNIIDSKYKTCALEESSSNLVVSNLPAVSAKQR